jgi:acyl carrier protein
MLPSLFVCVGAFPMTHNGKIDFERLPEPASENTLPDETSPQPMTPTEQRIATIVTGLLGLESVGRDDNFFLLGGHSLLAAQLIARLRDAFGVEIPMRALFAAPTVSLLATRVENTSGPVPPAATHPCAVTNS